MPRLSPSAARTLPVAATLLLLSACNSDPVGLTDEPSVVVNSAADVPQLLNPGPQSVPNEMLVRFKPGTSAAARGRALGRVNGSVAERILTAAMRRSGDDEGVTLVRMPMAAMQAIAAIKGDDAVVYAEPNWVYQHQQASAFSNDPYYTNGSLWGAYGAATTPANQFGSGAASVWVKAGGRSCAGVVIGIIDEGYMYTHTDLAPNAGTNPGEGTTANGVDNDGNGLVDDIYGWDFAGNNSTVFDGVTDDHGTHVAGTIGAAGNNGTGISGICQTGIKMLNAKFLGSTGGTTANAIKAVDYFTDLKTRHGLNLVATNNSWGGGGFSQALKDAIDRAGQQNILFVAAAGNSGTDNDATASYPSGYSSANIIAVASITSTGALSSFSQYGATTVDIGAPGSGIWSTVPVRSGKLTASSYASYNGTSMATPHVAGAVALYAARNPGSSAAIIKAAIMNSATSTPSLNGKVVSNGRLNVSGF